MLIRGLTTICNNNNNNLRGLTAICNNNNNNLRGLTAICNNNNNNNNNHIERRKNLRFSHSPHCAPVSNMYTQVARAQSCANHMHTSSAYHMPYVMCHVVQRHSSAIKLDRAEIPFCFSLILLAETIIQ